MAKKKLQRAKSKSNGTPKPAARRTNRQSPPRATLTQLDRELLALADEVAACAASARNIVLRAATQLHVRRLEPLDSRKRREVDRMRAMILAWRSLRDEEGAPYRDARMLLTDQIVFVAAITRPEGKRSRRGWRRPPVLTVGTTEDVLDQRAANVAAIVADHYPALAAKLRQQDRIRVIRATIEATASSTTAQNGRPRRMPWQLFATCWDGIGARPIDPETWRKDYARHRRRAW